MRKPRRTEGRRSPAPPRETGGAKSATAYQRGETSTLTHVGPDPKALWPVEEARDQEHAQQPPPLHPDRERLERQVGAPRALGDQRKKLMARPTGKNERQKYRTRRCRTKPAGPPVVDWWRRSSSGEDEGAGLPRVRPTPGAPGDPSRAWRRARGRHRLPGRSIRSAGAGMRRARPLARPPRSPRQRTPISR